MMRLLPVAIAAALPFLACCPGPKGLAKPDNLPSGDEFVAQLVAKQDAARSFKADSRMDYRAGNQRIKTTVYVMGERGAKVRFNALSPANTVARDLACDGINFAYVDFDNNCQLEGPCNSDAIAQLLRVNLEPDDFLALAIGGVPLLGDATATVEWNSKNGTAVLKLLARDNQHSQEIILDGKDATYDVLGATMRDAKGEVDWTLENKEFASVKSTDEKTFRVPNKTRFQQPKDKGDLKVRWEERELNLELNPQSFNLTLPGVPQCGAQAPPPPPPSTTPAGSSTSSGGGATPTPTP